MNWKHAFSLLGGALLLATLTSLEVYVNRRLVFSGEVPYAPIWVPEAFEWCMWAAFAPVVWWLESHHGTATGKVVRGAGIHLVAGGTFLVLLNVLMTLGYRAIGTPMPEHVGFWELVLRRASSEAVDTLLIYGLILGTAILVRETRNRTRQRATFQAELAEARLRYLRAQIQPHFLFNTLHGIAGLVREGERDEAVATIGRLGRLLRRALAVKAGERVELAEELEDLATYVEIQMMRFGDRLRFSTDVPQGLEMERVPALLLQPLVENAVQHGLRGAGGSIHVSARRESGSIVLRVCDDGAGLAPSFREGIGIGNLRERLATMYGGAARLDVRDRSPEPGVEATVRLPADASAVETARSRPETSRPTTKP